MAFLSQSDARFLDDLSTLVYSNPFSPDRVALVRQLLGSEYRDNAPATEWTRESLTQVDQLNLERIDQHTKQRVAKLQGKLASGILATERELALYEEAVVYLLYRQYRNDLDRLAEPNGPKSRVSFWKPFLHDFQHYLEIPGRMFPGKHDPARVLAVLFQVRRAMHHIFNCIIGASRPAFQLRARVWQSIFTHDFRRYVRSLYNYMGNVTTLITGPSGTGKELVASAVGMSRYIPFNPVTAVFDAPSLHALNLSAITPTLIESALFGHSRGAFTGATRSEEGWLSKCEPTGTLFLDEIGELDVTVQVKLLRVLETRKFQRLGEMADRDFRGKVIVATNRDLAAEMRAGRFREDLYWRLCADMVATPSLRQIIDDSRDDLRHLMVFIAEQHMGLDDEEAQSLADEVQTWIGHQKDLGPDYAWPGNVRELEQCMRNVMIHGEYHPARSGAVDGEDPRQALARAVTAGTLTDKELRRRYCTLVLAIAGNKAEAARRLGLNRQTLTRQIDEKYYTKLTQSRHLNKCTS